MRNREGEKAPLKNNSAKRGPKQSLREAAIVLLMSCSSRATTAAVMLSRGGSRIYAYKDLHGQGVLAIV